MAQRLRPLRVSLNVFPLGFVTVKTVFFVLPVMLKAFQRLGTSGMVAVLIPKPHFTSPRLIKFCAGCLCSVRGYAVGFSPSV